MRDYTKQVFLDARDSQKVKETVHAYYIVDLPTDTTDDTDDLRAALKRLMEADEDLPDAEYSIFYPTMNNPMIYDGGKLFPRDATQNRISDQATVKAAAN